MGKYFSFKKNLTWVKKMITKKYIALSKTIHTIYKD